MSDYLIKDQERHYLRMLAVVISQAARQGRERVALRRAEEDRDELIVELREALDQVKTLRGIVPICAGCKRIRDEQGFWQQVEVYVAKHTEAQFSHGLCGECMEQLYPSVADEAEGPAE